MLAAVEISFDGGRQPVTYNTDNTPLRKAKEPGPVRGARRQSWTADAVRAESESVEAPGVESNSTDHMIDAHCAVLWFILRTLLAALN